MAKTKKNNAAKTEPVKARNQRERQPTKEKALSGNGDPLQRENMIREAAYYLAEKQGFSGDPSLFWKQAEQEINSKRQAGKKKKK